VTRDGLCVHINDGYTREPSILEARKERHAQKKCGVVASPMVQADVFKADLCNTLPALNL